MYLYCTRSNKVFVFVFIFFRRYNWRAKHLFHCGLTPFAPPCLNLLLYRVLKARDFSCLRHTRQTGGAAGGIRRLLIYSLALSSSVREIPKSKEIWTLKSWYDWILTDKSTAMQWKWLPNIKATRKTHNSHQGSSELHSNQCISLLFSFLCLFLKIVKIPLNITFILDRHRHSSAGCGDTCQIWAWVKKYNIQFCIIGNCLYCEMKFE